MGQTSGESAGRVLGGLEHREDLIHVGEFQQDADPLAHTRERKLLSLALRMGPVAQNRSEARGIDIRAVGDIDDCVAVADVPQCILKTEEVIEPQWPFQAKDGGRTGCAAIFDDFKCFHST